MKKNVGQPDIVDKVYRNACNHEWKHGFYLPKFLTWRLIFFII